MKPVAAVAFACSAALVTMAIACGGDEETSPVRAQERERPPRPEKRPPAQPPGPAPLVERSRPLMGTIFKIAVAGSDDATAEPAIRRALDEVARLEGLLSEWREGSDISRINEAAGREPVQVSADTMTVLKAGLEVAQWSEGAFDVTWAPLRTVYDFRPGRERAPEPRDLPRLLRLIGYRNLVLDEEAGTAFLRRRGMQIGLGGIAKGYALDRAGAILEEAGLTNYIIFGGGQVQVHGRRGPRPWRVGIQHPRRADSYFAYFEATDGSIATAGDYEHAFVDAEGQRWHHILDLRTGLPVTHTMSVTVHADSGLHGDAIDTAIFILGAERGLRMAREIPFRVDAVVVDAEQRIHTTPGTMERLVFPEPLRDGQLP